MKYINNFAKGFLVPFAIAVPLFTIAIVVADNFIPVDNNLSSLRAGFIGFVIMFLVESTWELRPFWK